MPTTDHNCLNEVLTPAEIEREFGVKADTVKHMCQRGDLPARRTDRVWLILRSEAEKRWGKKP